MRRSRHAEAEAAFRSAVAAGPCDPAAHMGLGLALMEAGRYWDAAGALGEAGRLDPSGSRVQIALGAALAKAGRPTEAAAAYGRAARIEPERADIHAKRGRARAMPAGTRGRLRRLPERPTSTPGWPTPTGGLAARRRAGRAQEGACGVYRGRAARSPQVRCPLRGRAIPPAHRPRQEVPGGHRQGRGQGDGRRGHAPCVRRHSLRPGPVRRCRRLVRGGRQDQARRQGRRNGPQDGAAQDGGARSRRRRSP